MTIEVRIHHKTDERRFTFHFDGKNITDGGTDASAKKADLVLEYPAAVLSEMFAGRWTFRSLHSLFMFKARWKRLIYGQTNIMGWT